MVDTRISFFVDNSPYIRELHPPIPVLEDPYIS